MGNLETEIETLEPLDILRVRSARLRDKGRAAIEDAQNDQWIRANDPVEKALVCRALYCPAHKRKAPTKADLEKLEDYALKDAFDTSSDRVPVLRSARTMQALVGAPDTAFSEAVVYCTYRIIRELYTPDPPDWIIGGARAGNEGLSTAFITGECAKALSSLSRNLARTAIFLRGLKKLYFAMEKTEGYAYLSDWKEQELQRVTLDFYLTMRDFSGNIALRLEPPTSDITLDNLQDFLHTAIDNIEGALDLPAEVFEKAQQQIERFRSSEPPASRKSSEPGHDAALEIIERTRTRIREAQEDFKEAQTAYAKLAVLEDYFSRGATRVKRLLEPSRHYFSNVLDRELAAVSSKRKLYWDPAELVFAATSFGILTGLWHDDRIERVPFIIAEAMSDRGRLPAGRAFMTTPRGYCLSVIGSEVIHSFAQLLENTHGHALTPSLAQKLLAYFEDHKVDGERVVGWFPEGVQYSTQPYLWATALAVLALDKLNSMLDESINRKIFGYFSVQSISNAGADQDALTLNDLFYPDYGLAKAPTGIKRLESIAMTLERLRSHVIGVGSPKKDWSALHSLVLHGPPGTGKTTLVEALAASCRAPLVAITPSDIMVGGAEEIEKRARAVFKALSLLTGCVILFDEFEPVLWRRDPEEMRSILSFLTPGMLPKLKELHKSTSHRRSAYVLVTNMIGSLDAAAVRAGRFDKQVGVYPPDPLSRAGRLLGEVVEYYRDDLEQGKEFHVDFDIKRLLDVVRLSAGGGMQQLGSPGWFVRPRKDEPLKPGTPFRYLLEGGTVPDAVEPEGEPKGVEGEGDAAQLEYMQWQWITAWDRKVAKAEDFDSAIEEHPRTKPVKA